MVHTAISASIQTALTTCNAPASSMTTNHSYALLCKIVIEISETFEGFLFLSPWYVCRFGRVILVGQLERAGL
jgi:hypothetical protein